MPGAAAVEGIERPYDDSDVERLRGTVQIEHTLATRGAERLRELISRHGHIKALGASTGNQAVQQVAAGLEAIYVSGWQVAADPAPPAPSHPAAARPPP